MKKFKKHIMTVSVILLIILISSAPVFAQQNQKERVEEFPKGEQISILVGSFLSGIKDVNVVTRVYDAPYNKVWLAAKLTAEKLDKIGKRSLVLVDEKNGRTTNGVIDQNVLIGLGSGAWVDQFQIEVTSISDNKTKVDVTRKVVENEVLGGGHWKSQYSNSNIEKWVLTQIEDQINPTMMENTAVSKRNPTSESVSAQENQEEKKTKFGIGFQASFPAWGISGMLDVTPNVSIQGILGPVGDLKIYAGRGIYKFKKGPYWNAYGYGMLGAWSYPGYKITGWSLKETTETVMGFGAGAGIEFNWRGLGADFSNLPPIWWNFEIGLGSVKFKEIDYNLSTFMFGVGAHYRF